MWNTEDGCSNKHKSEDPIHTEDDLNYEKITILRENMKNGDKRNDVLESIHRHNEDQKEKLQKVCRIVDSRCVEICGQWVGIEKVVLNCDHTP